MTDVRETTLSERIFESCAMTSSVIPSVKYSLGHVLVDRPFERWSSEGWPPREHLEEHAGEAVKVRASVHFAIAAGLLGAHIARRSE
jgi:hypothetical protein